MPFLLYEYAPSDTGALTYRRLKRVALGGKSGPIATHVSNEYGGQPNTGWHMSESKMLEHFGGIDNRALLIDLKPNKRGNVSLYQLTDIWGFSYEGWTPICLRLESLFIDKEEEDVETFKQSFEFDPQDGGHVIHEFLYLRGGTNEGPWGWGMTGSVNSALLFRDAWEYFVRRIKYE